VSNSTPLPTNDNMLLALRRLREEVAALQKSTVSREEAVRSGLAKVGVDGYIIQSDELLAPTNATILGLTGIVTGAVSALEKLETWAFAEDGEYNIGARKLTQLDAEMRVFRGEMDGAKAAITAGASARDELLSRIVATEDRIVAEAKKSTELYARLNITDGSVTVLGTGIEANATAISDLTARVTVTETEIVVLASDVTTLKADLDIAESNIVGLQGTVAAQGSAISTLQTQVTANTNSITVLSSDVTNLQAGLAIAQNDIQVKNPGFEATSDWGDAGNGTGSLPAGFAYTTASKFAGNQSMQILGTGATRTLYNTALTTVKPGTRIRVSAMMSRDGSAVSGSATAGVQFRDSAGVLVGGANINAVGVISSIPTSGYGVVTAVGDVPANAATVRVYVQVNSAFNAGTVWVDEVQVERVGQDTVANASAISTLEARVTAAEGSITSQATSITNLQANIATIFGTGGYNLIPNPSAARDASGWVPSAGTIAAIPAAGGPSYFAPSSQASGTRSFTMSPNVPCLPNVPYTFSTDLFVAGSSTGAYYIDMVFYDASNNIVLDGANVGTLVRDSWVRVSSTETAPPTAASVRVRTVASGASFTDFRWTRAKLEQGPTATPYSEEAYVTGTASALSTLEARVTAAEGTITSQSTSITNLQAGLTLSNESTVGYLSGGFEDPSQWETNAQFTIANNATNARSGSRYLSVAAGAVGAALNPTAYVAVSSDQTLRAGFWAKNGASAPNGYVRMAVRWYNASKVQTNFVFFPNTSLNATASWTKTSGSITVPAGTAYARVAIQTGHTSGEWWVDDAFCEVVTESDTANASAYAALDARVTATEGSITSQSTSITRLTSSLDTAMSQGMTASANMVDDWITTSGTGELSIITSSDSSVMGGKLLQIGNNAGNDLCWARHRNAIPIDPNKLYRVRVRLRMSSGSAGSYYAGVACLTADQTAYVTASNTTNSTMAASPYVAVGLTNTSFVETVGYFKGIAAGARTGAGTLASPWTFPNLARFITPVFIGNYNNATGITYLDKIVIEDADAVGDNNTTASAVSTLSTQVTTNSNGITTLNSRYTLTLVAGNRISGIRSENTGNIASFEVISDIFKITSPTGTGARFEYSDSNIRIYDSAGTLRVRLGVW
jgi:hypothetical protein